MSQPTYQTEEAREAPPDSAGIFQEYCRRRGLDPKAEAARVEARQRDENRQRDAYLAQRRRAEEAQNVSLVDVLEQVMKALRRPETPAYLARLETPEQLKAFLLELLTDDLAKLIEAVLEVKKIG